MTLNAYGFYMLLLHRIGLMIVFTEFEEVFLVDQIILHNLVRQLYAYYWFIMTAIAIF